MPPTLVSFAVDIAKEQDIVTPELKKAGSKLVLLKVEKDAYDLPVYSQVMDLYGKFHEDILAGRVLSAYALDGKGLVAALSKMAFGNGLGFKIEHNVDERDLFTAGFGDIVAEVPAEAVGALASTYTVIGEVTEDAFTYRDVKIGAEEALEAWKGTLERVFKTESGMPTVGGGLDLDGEENRRCVCLLLRTAGRCKEVKTAFITPIRFMCAKIKWQNRMYLFRYSRVPTVSMTAQRRLREQALR